MPIYGVNTELLWMLLISYILLHISNQPISTKASYVHFLNFNCLFKPLNSIFSKVWKTHLAPFTCDPTLCSNVETISSWTCHDYGAFEFWTSLSTSILIRFLPNFEQYMTMSTQITYMRLYSTWYHFNMGHSLTTLTFQLKKRPGCIIFSSSFTKVHISTAMS